VMASDPAVIPEEMNASEAAGMMRQHDVGSLPVVSQDGALVGIVTDRDLVTRVLATRADPDSMRIGDVATMRELVTVEADATLHDAMDLMASNRIKRLPVVEDGALIGVVSMGDVAFASDAKGAVGETVARILEPPSATLVEGLLPGRTNDPGTS